MLFFSGERIGKEISLLIWAMTSSAACRNSALCAVASGGRDAAGGAACCGIAPSAENSMEIRAPKIRFTEFLPVPASFRCGHRFYAEHPGQLVKSLRENSA